MKLTLPFTGIITGEGPAGIDANAEFGGVLVGSHPGDNSKELLIP
jgi:hypothetical protein